MGSVWTRWMPRSRIGTRVGAPRVDSDCSVFGAPIGSIDELVLPVSRRATPPPIRPLTRQMPE